jgi:hypothetical protein
MLRHRFESIKYAPALKAPTYVLRAAFDDVVPHSHTDQLVAKLAQLCGDDIVPDSDHMNIPYLEGTQGRIATFLTAQFAQAVREAVPADSSAAVPATPVSTPAGAIPVPALAAAAIDAAMATLLPAAAAAIPAPSLAATLDTPTATIIPAPADPITLPGLTSLPPSPVPAESPVSGK